MDLDDIKDSWKSVGKNPGDFNAITRKKLEKMIQQQYHSKLRGIFIPELIGSITCLFGAFFIAAFFHMLDTPFLKITGIMGILLLIAAPVLSLISMYRLHTSFDVTLNHKSLLKKFSAAKAKFYKAQIFQVVFSQLLLAVFLVVFPRFYNETLNNTALAVFFVLGSFIVLGVSYWTISRYKRKLNAVNNLIEELGRN